MRPALMNLIDIIANSEAVRTLCDAAQEGIRVAARGSQGSSASFTAAAVSGRAERSVVLVVAHLDEADEMLDELSSAGVRTLRLPALEALPDETAGGDLVAERLAVLRGIGELSRDDAAGWTPTVLICPIQALMQRAPARDKFEDICLSLHRGDTRGPERIVRWLHAGGYVRMDAIEEPGQFSVRGGILDVFPLGSETAAPVRLDFFGEELDRISEIDIETMGSDRTIDTVELVSIRGDATDMSGGVSPVEYLPSDAIVILHETMEIVEQGRGYFERVMDASGVIGPPAILESLQRKHRSVVELNQYSSTRLASDVAVELPVGAAPELPQDVGAALADLRELSRDQRIIVFCQNEGELSRLSELLAEFVPDRDDRIERVVSYVHRGFIWNGVGRGTVPLLVVPYHELLHRFETRRRPGRIRASRAMDTFLEFEPGDYVVHREHGIAQFIELRVMQPKPPKRSEKIVLPGEIEQPRKRRKTDPEEFLTLQFAGGARLHVPATKIDQVQKYVGGFKGKPPLSKLGGVKWKRQKESVSESVRDLAGELLRVRAARESLPGIRFPSDTAWQSEFEAEFPYQETDDQLAALAEIKRDMQSDRPMDRLLCGDVGYGKTELAIRAAFKACEFGKQVAVLVPTTVLAEQHERTFVSRFADYPFTVESLSRFKTNTEINATLAKLRKGQIDVVIGTHRLLSKDVKFADLGLVIVDEEQRFGVEHKERLLGLRMVVDVLTLSATPIPRTLHMSMLGLRDISSLATAPLDRRAVVTEVIPFNEIRIRRAIERELSRDGQVFYVHNRVHNILSVADDIQRLVPDARIVVGHGQMPDRELERVMLKFVRREADVLVSTTIIESGIDVPTANTMIINDADRFGLADLHQLRGRVGRYKHRAYCYLLLPESRTTSEKAIRRLKAIEEFSMLGAGFKIAMRDLEIRGAGNILGPQQSGHIAAVGYEMYCQLLDRAVRELKGEVTPMPSETAVEIGVSGIIPKAYIPSDLRRMAAYRRLASAATLAQLDGVGTDLRQAYGDPPEPVQRLIDLSELRVAAHLLGVRTMTLHERDIVIRAAEPREIADTFREATGSVRVVQDRDGSCQVYYRPPPQHLEPQSLLNVLRHRLVAAASSRKNEFIESDRPQAIGPSV